MYSNINIKITLNCYAN